MALGEVKQVSFEEFYEELKLAPKFTIEVEPEGLLLTLPGENGSGPKVVRSPDPREVDDSEWQGFMDAVSYILNLRGWTP